ncbi:MAG: hypothetical protein ACI85N_002405 [Gammaproteobacteria bacterium]|jgi:hypothetical protein
MPDVIERSGTCLCGSISFTAKHMSTEVGACHCNMCRKWGGGPYMEVDCGPDVVFTGAENISCYQSSEWAERGFCSQCGTHLFYRLKEGNLHMIPVGLFEDDQGLRFKKQVFIEEKPSFYSFSNETKNYTGYEIVTEFLADKA